ncbi:MAG: hypothetical protein ACQES2_10555 [Pseudomonadota bacterium]
MASTETLIQPPVPLYLAGHSQADLDALYATLPTPAADELEGDYRGTLLGIRGLSTFPGLAKEGIYRLLATRLNPWWGKQFDAAEGANLWAGTGSRTPWGYFHIRDGGASASLQLDYDHPANPALLRPVLGEVRRLGAGTYLARMRYRSRRGVVTLLYFTLQAAS